MRAVRLLPALLVLLAAGQAEATPQDLFGLGARTPALAMTGVSYAGDYEAAFANPAGLARARRRGIHLGVAAAGFDLTVDGQRSPLDPARGMTIGATLPIPFHDVLEDRLVLGLAVYTPQQVLLRGQILGAGVSQWPVLSRAQSLAIDVGLGFDFHSTALEGLRLGIGVVALANVIGNLDVRLDETNAFASVVETQLLAAFSPIAGASYDLGALQLGLVYRHEVRSEMNLAIHVSDLPIPVPVLNVGGLVQYDPAQLAAEASYRIDPDILLVAGLTTRFWSFYPGSPRATTASSNLAPAPDFSTTVSPRAAIEGTLHGRDRRVSLALRGGYLYEMTPSPPARLAPVRRADGSPAISGGMPVVGPLRLLDADRHVLTAGVGFSYELSPTERMRLDLYGQAHFLADRTHLVGAADGGPNMQTGGAVLVGGWTFTLEF